MSNFFLNPNSNLATPPIKSCSIGATPFYPVQPLPPQTHNTVFSGSSFGEMHDVVLDHLKVGDEVVWMPDGKSVSIHTLDIGRVQRTLYHVDGFNQEALLAVVDFHDWVEGSHEIRDHGGARAFRLRVFAKHLKRLGDFLESINSRNGSLSLQDVNNNGRSTNKSNRSSLPTHFNPTNPIPTSTSGARSYVVRPCTLASKRPSSHPLISESDQIYVFFNNTILPGVVKRLFVGDGNNFFIGAEFGGVPVFPNLLPHSHSCPFRNNGCESRIGIQISNLSKYIWDSEFRLIVNGTKQITFEDLFYKEEAPPSYSVATSLMPQPQSITAPQINYNVPPPASAPPLTPSPPPAFVPIKEDNANNWTKFNTISPQNARPESLHDSYLQPQPPPPASPGLGSLSKNYSASMMNLDSCGMDNQNPKPVLSQRPPKVTTPNRQSLLVDELKKKLKIGPKPQTDSHHKPAQFLDESPQVIAAPEMATPPPSEPTSQETRIQPKRVSLNNEPNSFMEELRRRQQGKTSRPISMGIPNPTTPAQDKNKPQRLSLPPKPVQNSSQGQDQAEVKNGYKRPDAPFPFPATTRQNSGGLTTTGGMTRSISCMNISDTKPPTTPKPMLAPKPIKSISKGTVSRNQFLFSKPETEAKPLVNPVPTIPKRLPIMPPSSPLMMDYNTKIQPISKTPKFAPAIPTDDLPPPLPSRSSVQVSTPQKKVEQEIPEKPSASKYLPPPPPSEVCPDYANKSKWKPPRPQTPPQIQKLPPVKSNLYPDLNSELKALPPSTNSTEIKPTVYKNQCPSEPESPPQPQSTPTFRPYPEQVDLYPLSHSHQETEIKPESHLSRNPISRDHLPPPPPPPPPFPHSTIEAENNLSDCNNEDEADFPPPPPEAICDPVESEDNYKQNQDNISKEPDQGRGTLLQQIRQGIKLRPRVEFEDSKNESSNSHNQSKSQGFENIIKGAIATRRVMLDSDEESNNSEYDEDSDAWD